MSFQMKMELNASSDSNNSLSTISDLNTPSSRGDTEVQGRPRSRTRRPHQRDSITPRRTAATTQDSSSSPGSSRELPPAEWTVAKLHSELRRRGVPFHLTDRKPHLLALLETYRSHQRLQNTLPGDTVANMDRIPDSFRDIILRSTLIRKGPPDHYRLTTKKENLDGKTDKESMLRRWTVGKKDTNKPNKTILLVGETGSGKSSLINAMVNYVMGVKMQHKVWFEIVDETNKKMQTESQTSAVTVYEIFGYEGVTVPYSLTIIDTPGYGDTTRIEQDEIITDMLHDLFRSKNGIQEIDAVGLVLKAAENRLDDRLTYIFDSVVSLFSKDMEKNIVALITHSDGMPPEDALEALEAANIKCAKDEKNQPVHFLFNNRQNTVITEEIELAMEYAWGVTERGIGKFSNFLEGISSQKLQTTVHVLDERVRLTACVNNLKERIELIELKQTAIKQTQDALKTYKEEMANNKNYTVEVDEVYKDKEPIISTRWRWNNKAVTCNVCEENCHYPGCILAMSPSWCEVMKNDSCTSCTRKCPSSDHVKEGWRWVNKTRKADQTLQDVKDKYEKNKEEVGKKKGLLSEIQEQMEELKANKATYLEEAYQHVVILEEISLNADSQSTQMHLDFLIEKIKETGNTEKVQRLEKMKSRVDQRAKDGLRYRFGQLKDLFHKN